MKLFSTHSSFFNTSFLSLRVNEVAVLKIFRSLLNLLQVDGPKNELLFQYKLLFLKGISKAICDLVLCVFLEGANSSFTENSKFPFQYLNTFVATRCSTLFLTVTSSFL